MQNKRAKLSRIQGFHANILKDFDEVIEKYVLEGMLGVPSHKQWYQAGQGVKTPRRLKSGPQIGPREAKERNSTASTVILRGRAFQNH